MGNDSKITVDHLTHVYRTRKSGSVEALSDVSFSVRDRELVSVIGPTGCGKTTLLKIVGGLMQPTQGTVRIDGVSTEAARRSAKFGFVFQSPTLVPWRNALENTRLPLEILQRADADPDEKSREVLRLVGMTGFEEAYPRELSGGMAHRIAIARALVFDPEILLMDEPFASLDEPLRERMNLELLRIWSQTRKTIVFVTHIIPEAIFLANKVIVFSKRPGAVRRIIEVNLPSHRTQDVRDTKEYFDLIQECRKALDKYEEA